MSTPLDAFICDCKQHSNLKYVLDHLSWFDPALRQIYYDKGIANDDETIGKNIIETGVALFAYLADVLENKGMDGLKYWNVVTQGYQDHEHTDLYMPFFDVARTQLLWINASERLSVFPIEIHAELLFNLIFRWNIASIELMRKMLVFCNYCRSNMDGSFSSKTLLNQLHGTGDPTTSLKNRAPSGRGEVVSRYFDRTVRHALSHGNVCLAMPTMMILRTTDGSKGTITQREYRLQTDPIDKIQRDLLGHAEPCYQAVRVFFIIYTKLQHKHTKLLKDHWKIEDNPVMSEMYRIVQDNPDGLKYWEKRT